MGNGGRRLLKQVEEHTGKYFTQKGRERDELSRPRKRVEQLAEVCKDLGNELQAYEDQVNHLGKLQEKLARYQRDGVLSEAREEAEKANAAVRQLESVEGMLDMARRAMDQAGSTKDLAEGDRKRRRTLAKEVEATDRQARAAEDALRNLEPDYREAERRLAEAETVLTARNRLRDQTNETWNAARQALECARFAGELQNLDRQFQQAKALYEQIERTQQEITSNPVDEDCLHQLQDLRQQQIRLDSSMEAAAATLVFFSRGRSGCVAGWAAG